jgi:eukaryotic-like serine/threonine-protein kinase
MNLKAGTHLGPYEIVSPLGAGGMGEVYRARDTRLVREVAIKVLPESFSKDSDRLRRFEQEARAASQLNHPNIVTVHDFGMHRDVPYVVEELLEGETLREHLRRGALPARKVVEYGIEAARGLAAAHEKGIVHRDLKPENLFLTSDGRLKILDFGLAKLAATERPAAEQNDLPTATQATAIGIVMGTLGYMSPEQVRGQTVDQRADIFALGAILYEMLSGASAFKRQSSADTMSAILKEDSAEFPSDSKIPPALERIVRRCLEKQPNQRFQAASDVAFALEALSGTAPHPVDAAVARPSPRWTQRLVLALALAGAVAIGVLADRLLLRSGAPPPKFTAVTFRRGTVFNARFSPDGNSIYYAAAWDGNPVDVYAASHEDPEARSLGVSGDPLLALSRKGELAILTHAQYLYQLSYVGTLALLPPSGGSPREVLENVREADFAPDGETMAVVRAERGKTILEYPAGHVLYETPGWISYMRISPDGNRVAFFDHNVIVDDRGDVAVVDRNGKRAVLSHDWEAEDGLAWSADGKEVWFTATKSGAGLALRAVTLDGKERAVLTIPSEMRVLDIARDGRALISRGSRREGISALLEGEKRERDLSWLDSSVSMHLSDDGRLIAFDDFSEPTSLYYAACIRKTDGSPVVRLGEGAVLAVSPDARWVLTVKYTTPPQLVMLPVGAGQPKVLPRGNLAAYQVQAAWSHDGKRLLFTGSEAGTGNRVYVQEVGGGDPRPISPEGYRTFSRSITTDDASLIVAGPDGSLVRMAIGGGSATPIPGTQPGDQLVGWARDGKRIFVYHPAELRPRIFTVDLGNGERRLWKQIEPPDPVGLMPFRSVFADLTPDGRNIAYQYDRFIHELYVAEGIR